MTDDDGLTYAEELVLDPLEDSPLPLWELPWDGMPPARLVPGLISLAARGFIEVRRFESWPARWNQGSPVVGDDLVRQSAPVEAWSRGSGPVLAAHITKAGVAFL
jgi:hypothetical protein